MKLFYLLLLVLLNEIGCFDPTPPQPCQYTAVFYDDGVEVMHYLDTTFNFERLLRLDGESDMLYDCKNRKVYYTDTGKCEWETLPVDACPVMQLKTYQFLANETYRGKLCNKWNGTLRFIEPELSVIYYATVEDNLPMALHIPDDYAHLYYSNVILGPPSPSDFPIPKNCTNTGSQQRIFPNLIFKRKNRNKA